MKKRPVLHQLASFFIAFCVFFVVASYAQADTLTIPQQYTYPGLTFTTPLTYTNTTTLPQQTTNITFTSQNELTLTKTTTQKPLEAIVLTPTVAEETPTTTISPEDEETPTPTVTAISPTPSSQPTEQELSPTPIPYTPDPQANPGGLNASDLFSMVNAYRASQGLPALQQDTKTCSLAQERAPEVAGEVSSGNMHAGLEAMNLPYWNTENIISMNSDQAAFNWWINDPIHHEAIVGNFTYSCVACSGNSCAEEFTSYQPK
jgi:uncharacterized protein YkwD